MKAVRSNKEYTITETEQKSYQTAGYDIIGDDGAVIAYGRGKTVSFDEYEKLRKELEEVKGALKQEEPQPQEETTKPAKASGKK